MGYLVIAIAVAVAVAVVASGRAAAFAPVPDASRMVGGRGARAARACRVAGTCTRRGAAPASAETARSVAAAALAKASSTKKSSTGMGAGQHLDASPAFQGLPSQSDRSYARLLVATAERRLGQIDSVLSGCIDRTPTGRHAAAARACLRLGAAQLLFLDTPAHAAVKETVDVFKMGGGGERHGKGPKDNPSYSDGRLFTTSISGILSAWDADSGKLLWRKVPGRRFGQSHAHWGASNSPLVLGNMIVNLFGNEEAGALMALDVASGERIWSMGNDGTCYSSPFSVEIDGVRQIVAWNHRALVGVEPADGRLLWEYPFPHKTHNQNMPTPAFHDGKILLGAENRGLHSIEPVLRKGKWSVSITWTQKELALDMASAIVAEGFFYGLSHYGQGRLFCLDPEM